MYAKIFATMFKGSMYGNPDGIITFMLMLVLCDREGIVDFTPEAIAAHTSIPLDIIQRGLKYLAQPDPMSRTPDQGGRRIALLDDHREWGWYIVNYEKYRDMRNEQDRREYQRNWARNKRAKNKTQVTGIPQEDDSSIDNDGQVSTAEVDNRQSRQKSTSQTHTQAHTQTQILTRDSSTESESKTKDPIPEIRDHYPEWSETQKLYPPGTYKLADFLEAQREAEWCVDQGLTTWPQWREAVSRMTVQHKARGGSNKFIPSPKKFFHRDSRSWMEPFNLPDTPVTVSEARGAEIEREARVWVQLKEKAAVLGFRAPWPVESAAVYETALRIFEQDRTARSGLNGHRGRT